MMKAEPLRTLPAIPTTILLKAEMNWSLAGSSPSCLARQLRGGDDLFGQSEPASQIAYIADSEATTIAALKDDFNALLAALRELRPDGHRQVRRRQ